MNTNFLKEIIVIFLNIKHVNKWKKRLTPVKLESKKQDKKNDRPAGGILLPIIWPVTFPSWIFFSEEGNCGALSQVLPSQSRVLSLC